MITYLESNNKFKYIDIKKINQYILNISYILFVIILLILISYIIISRSNNSKNNISTESSVDISNDKQQNIPYHIPINSNDKQQNIPYHIPINSNKTN